MKVIENKIIKSEFVNWKSFKYIQPDGFKDLTKSAYEKLKQSIIKNGFVEAFKVWEHNGDLFCLDGYHRCKALDELSGMANVPDKFRADFINCKNRKEAADLVLIYSSIYARINDESLYEFLNIEGLDFEAIKDTVDIPNIDMEQFEIGYMTDENEGLTDDDAIPEAVESRCKTGDLWLLGNHRLFCGDATKSDDVEMLMDGEKSYNMLTDPPYNIEFKYNEFSDKKTESEYATFCHGWFNSFKPKSLIFSPGPRNEKFYPEPKDRGVWIKRNATAGASVFNFRLAEPLLFYGEFKKKRTTDVFDFSTGFTKELKDAQQAAGVLDKHAPAKSMPLWVELVKMFDDKIIVDCFSGNGTTFIACEKTSRACYGIEIDAYYCDVIIQRWEEFTGNEAKLSQRHPAN